jgi:3-oxoacyl-[acyl-carrier protein] reductase
MSLRYTPGKEMDNMDLQNKITVITGVTGGLGRVVAREFAAQGTKLVLVGTNAERLEQLVAELKLTPESYETVVADLTQSGAAQEVLEAALAKFGRVDIVVEKNAMQLFGDRVASTLKETLWLEN